MVAGRWLAVVTIALAAIIAVLVGLHAFRPAAPDGRVEKRPPKEGQPAATVLRVGVLELNMPSSYSLLFKEPFSNLVSYRFRGPEGRLVRIKHFRMGRDDALTAYGQAFADAKSPRFAEVVGRGRLEMKTDLGNPSVRGFQFLLADGAYREFVLAFFPRDSGRDFYEIRLQMEASAAALAEAKSILRTLRFMPAGE